MPLPPIIALPLSALIGLLVGSFLATLVLRLPKGEPVVFSRSACPQCGHVLGATELVPLLSWLFQNRRCKACRGRISAFYPIMELASAAVAAVVAWYIPWPALVVVWIVGWIGLCFVAWGLRALH